MISKIFYFISSLSSSFHFIYHLTYFFFHFSFFCIFVCFSFKSMSVNFKWRTYFRNGILFIVESEKMLNCCVCHWHLNSKFSKKPFIEYCCIGAIVFCGGGAWNRESWIVFVFFFKLFFWFVDVVVCIAIKCQTYYGYFYWVCILIILNE